MYKSTEQQNMKYMQLQIKYNYYVAKSDISSY